MKKIDAILFDLDDTLVNTSKLQQYREQGDRDGLNENIHKSFLFKPVTNMLHKIKEKGIPLALVTNSPRWYTDAVLKHHNIDLFDVKICYDDVLADGKKPSAKGILLALRELKVGDKPNAIYIGDQDTDYIASYIAGIKPIAPSWAKRDPISQIPAAIACSNQIIDNFDNYDELSLIADRTALMRKFDFPKKQLNFIPLNNKGELVPLNKEDIKLISFGRYFSQSTTLTAKLHERHPLSKDIYAKEGNEKYIVPNFYVELLSKAVEKLPTYIFGDTAIDFDIVTIIPSKKGKNPRLENMLNRISKIADTKSQFINDIFEFAQGAKGLKTLGGQQNRMQELQKSMSIKPKYIDKLAGKKILIIDDVITTGSTFNHAFNLLEKEQVSFSFGACLAKTVSMREEDKICSKCGRLMKIKSRKGDGIHFYGCTGFYETVDKCTHTESIKVKDCPLCGDIIVTKYSRNNEQYFLGCEGYKLPQRCQYTERLEQA